ncbi:MAG: hypothetical protein RIU67_1001 [Actinomycetota bacterium]
MKVRRTMVSAAAMLTLVNCGGSSPEATGRLDAVRSEPTRAVDPVIERRPDSTTALEVPIEEAVVVEWGFAELMAKRGECSRDPWSCDVDDLAVSESPAHRDLSDFIDRRRRHGIVASKTGALIYEVEGIDEISPELAHVAVCITDDVVLTMRVPGGGEPAIFDESMSSYRMVFVTQRTPMGWRWVEFSTTDRVVGEDLCVAS